jgi:ankyrin repeat protein
MSYQERVSKNFAKYCKEGKQHLVSKWLYNINIDINWNQHSPLRLAVKANQIEVVKMLLENDDLKTDYENDNRHLTGSKAGLSFRYEMNPLTEAIITKNYEILDIFIKSGKFLIKREENLDILLNLDDEELNEYFKKINGFSEYAVKKGYVKIVSKEAAEVFLF